MSSARNALATTTNPSALIAQPVAPIAPIATLISTRAGLVLRLSDVGVDVEVSGIGTIVGGGGHDIVTLSDDNAIPVSVSRVEGVRGTVGTYDHVRLGNFGNNMTVHAIDEVTGGMGYDSLTLVDNTPITVSGVEYVRGNMGVDTVQLLDRPNSITTYGVEQVIGGSFNDRIVVDPIGGILDDLFTENPVGSKDAALYGGGGDDTLEGGAGADTLVGGEGANTIYAGDRDTVWTQSGQDTIYLSGGYTTVMVDESLLGDGLVDAIQYYRNDETGMMEAWTEFGDAPIFTFSATGETTYLRIVGVGEVPAFDTTFFYDAERGAWM